MAKYTPTEFNRLFFKPKKHKFFKKWDYNHYKMEYGLLPNIIEIELRIGGLPLTSYSFGLGYDVKIISKKTGRNIHTDFFDFNDIFKEAKKFQIYIKHPKITNDFHSGIVGIEWDAQMVSDEKYQQMINAVVDNFIERIIKKITNWTL